VSFAFDSINLEVEKIMAVAVATRELMAPGPSVERTIRSILLGGLFRTHDRLLLDPSESGSLTDGIAPVSSTGTSAAQLTTDFGNLLAGITTSGSSLVWVMRPLTSARVALGLGAAAAELPARLFGLPVVLSRAHRPNR
jgi:hypothetical protein